MRRAIAALFAACLLTAFAPAPLPRKASRGEVTAINLETCQGTWQIVRDEVVTANGWSEKPANSRAIRIKGGQWTSIDKQGGGQSHWNITIDGSSQPARIAWHSGPPRSDSAPSWAGLVRRHEGNLQVTYMPPSNVARDFASLPVGAVVLTLRRGE